MVGAFAALLTVEDGAGEAIATALGAAAGAVAVSGLDAAAEILARLKDADAGRADLVIAAPPNGHGPGGSPPRTTAPGPLPDGVRLAADLVKAPGEFAPAVAGLLDGVAVAPDLAQAREVLRRHPGLRVVTLDGDLLGAHWARGGTAGAQSLIGLRAAAAEATTGLREADLACQHAERQLAEASDEEARARQAAAEALAGLQEADAAAAEISGRLGTLAGAAKAATDEASRLAARIAAAGRGQEKDQARLAELEHQLEQADAEADAARADQTAADLTPAQARAERERLADLAVAARDTEMDCPARGAHRRGAAAGHHRPGRLADRRGGHRAPGPGAGPGPGAAASQGGRTGPGGRRGRQRGGGADRPSRWPWPTLNGRPPRWPAGAAATGSRRSAARSGCWPASWTRSSTPRTARRSPRPPGGCSSISSPPGRSRSSRSRWPSWSPSTGPRCGVPPGDDDALPVPYDRAAQEKRAQSAAAAARPARQGQPAGAGGVRRAGGTARVPGHPA